MTKTMKIMEGTLIRPLSVGSRALFLHWGGLVRTSPVMAIHSVTEDEVRFETMDTTYRLLTRPTREPATSLIPLAMAA